LGVTVNVALFTTCDTALEVLVLNVESPPYTAVMEWAEGVTVSALVLKVATPELSVPVPRVVAPSLKVTVPVGGPPEPLTFAVKVTEAPYVEGFAEDERVVVVAVPVTVTVSVGNVPGSGGVPESTTFVRFPVNVP